MASRERIHCPYRALHKPSKRCVERDGAALRHGVNRRGGSFAG